MSVSRRCAVALIASLSVLALADDAGGSSVEASGDIRYVADAGEVNDLTMSGGPAVVTITDNGATINPGTNCQAVSANQVTCSPGSSDAFIVLDDGADRLDAAAFQGNVRVQGGDGDDTLRGSD